MPIFTKESLETLRQRIDLVEVMSGHIDLKRSGAAYKAICPFHEEKTPSLTIQKGDSHYHCYGCGAHGDAIQFLMEHLKLSFLEAVDSLAQRFHVAMQKNDSTEDPQDANKPLLKAALEKACHFYHFYLLHTPEGHRGLNYLYERGIDLDFVRQFEIGLAPRAPGLFRRMMHAYFIKDSTLLDAGLLANVAAGGYRDFFTDRITFPIRNSHGAVIGFSARKYREETFGGKYVNSPETSLFKKSRILFGLNYSRRRIAKERQALVVEGQIDALRLIQAGFNFTVASQGTAFGEGHARELLNLGIQRLYIAPDGDTAGLEASLKIGDLFQREGVEVQVLGMPPESDPDAFLCSHGQTGFMALMEQSKPYLDFLVERQGRGCNMDSPAGKTQLTAGIAKQIRSWKSPLMVHESLRRLAYLLQVPESALGIGQEHVPNLLIKRSGSAGMIDIDPDRILEFDFLRWLLVAEGRHALYVDIAQQHLTLEAFKLEECREIYCVLCQFRDEQKTWDLLTIAMELENSEAQRALSELLLRKVNKERADLHFLDTLQRILDRNWMEQREALQIKIQSGCCSDDEAMDLVKLFDELRRNPPKISEELKSKLG